MTPSSARTEPARQPAAGALVDAAWLEAHLRDPAVRVVEVDVSRRAHDEWHIDGAVLWDVYRGGCGGRARPAGRVPCAVAARRRPDDERGAFPTRALRASSRHRPGRPDELIARSAAVPAPPGSS